MENPRSVYSTACASGGMRSLPEQGIPTFQRPRSVNFSFSWKSGTKFIVTLSAQRVHKEPNMEKNQVAELLLLSNQPELASMMCWNWPSGESAHQCKLVLTKLADFRRVIGGDKQGIERCFQAVEAIRRHE